MVREKSPPAAGGVRPTAALKLQRIEAVVNAAAGSVEKGAAESLQKIVASFGLNVHVADVRPHALPAAVKAAVAAKPDLVIVLAGDGTARLAAEMCGPEGPLLAPLPGGTMNMLPKALYGARTWEEALTDALQHGEVRTISGGEVAGKAFYVSAILGAPALWADAREAMRSMKLWMAILRARRACMRAFRGKLHFDLGGGRTGKAEALTLMCPLVSRALTVEQALEADALDPQGVAEAFRLGLRAAFGGLLGDWRKDPAVETNLALEGRAWANGRIPAILDGEPHRFPRSVKFRFKPAAFRVLAPPIEPPPETPEKVIGDSVKSAL
jgi:diacylglycerol kinase family enzyme